MKNKSSLPFGKLYVLGAAIFASLALSVQAQYSLFDGNSRADINPNSQAGMYNWFVDGTDQLSQQWFWYGIDGNREFSLDTISAANVVQSSTNNLTTTYNNGLLNVRVDYTLAGGTPGSGVSAIGESITVRNQSGSALNLRFYQYSDFDLLGTSRGDAVELDRDVFGRFNYALQTEGPVIFSETGITPGATHGQVAFFPVIINSLNDALPTTLTDVAGPLGPGDATFAFEWDVVLQDGASLVISKTKYVNVPEPSALALMALGVLGVILRRNRAA